MHKLPGQTQQKISIGSSSNPITVNFVPPRNAHQKAQNLNVVIVGIFGVPESDVYQGISSLIYKNQKDHDALLILPNPWASSVVKSGIRFIPGNVPAEHTFNAELISNFLKTKKLKFENGAPKKLNLFGVSYGGFLTPGVRPILQKMNLPDGENVLIAPPLDLAESMQALDKVPALAKLEKGCRSSKYLDNLLWAHVAGLSAAELSNDIKSCLYTILAEYSFFPSLNETAQALGTKAQFNGSFESYLENYHGVCVDSIADQCYSPQKLESWLIALESSVKREQSFRVISAWNDPLNTREQWTQLKSAHPTWKLEMYKKGGHTEFWHFPSFSKWLKMSL